MANPDRGLQTPVCNTPYFQKDLIRIFEFRQQILQRYSRNKKIHKYLDLVFATNL